MKIKFSLKKVGKFLNFLLPKKYFYNVKCSYFTIDGEYAVHNIQFTLISRKRWIFLENEIIGLISDSIKLNELNIQKYSSIEYDRLELKLV